MCKSSFREAGETAPANNLVHLILLHIAVISSMVARAALASSKMAEVDVPQFQD